VKQAVTCPEKRAHLTCQCRRIKSTGCNCAREARYREAEMSPGENDTEAPYRQARKPRAFEPLRSPLTAIEKRPTPAPSAQVEPQRGNSIYNRNCMPPSRFAYPHYSKLLPEEQKNRRAKLPKRLPKESERIAPPPQPGRNCFLSFVESSVEELADQKIQTNRLFNTPGPIRLQRRTSICTSAQCFALIPFAGRGN
jgi:hypothetical protein